jgi:hypothetical protein
MPVTRLVVAAAGASLLAATGSAFAASAISRTVSGEYTGPSSTPAATVQISGSGSAGVQFQVQRGERRVTVTARDTTGRPVLLDVTQLVDTSAGKYVELGTVCIQAGTFALSNDSSPVVVFPETGTCAGGTSTPTTGTVTASFVRR